MAQPQRGSVTPVDDLRNIIDRLDLLMDTTANASAAGSRSDPSARDQIEHVLTQLGDRVDTVERETDELRTLVNHLMTIATWQAKVTATLVAEQQGDDEAQPDAGAPARAAVSAHAAAGGTREPAHDPATASGRRDRVPEHVFRGSDQPGRRAAPSLDEDIDDILGTHRAPPSEIGPPPDFGI